MTAVFSHGRLRLYLLKLLAEGPKHGYELIRMLKNRFLGLYSPSAGTIYPRLQRMEVEGLVTHAAVGGRKIYEITDAGRAELEQRADELAALEADIHASVADLSLLEADISAAVPDLSSLANEIQEEVHGSIRDIKRELREQTRQARAGRWLGGAAGWLEDGRSQPGPGSASAAQLERRAGELAAEVRRLTRRPGVAEPILRAATEAVETALAVLRRL